jgi:hypothetical protein
MKSELLKIYIRKYGKEPADYITGFGYTDGLATIYTGIGPAVWRAKRNPFAKLKRAAAMPNEKS